MGVVRATLAVLFVWSHTSGAFHVSSPRMARSTRHAAQQPAHALMAASRPSARPGDTIFAADDRPVILFDGTCNLCNGAVNFILDWDRPDDVQGTFRLASMHSPAGRALLKRAGRREDDTSAIVLSCRDDAYIKSDAVLRIWAALGRGTAYAPLFAAAGTLALALPRPARDVLCDVASEARTLFGHGDFCRLSDDRFDARFLSEDYECVLSADGYGEGQLVA